MKRSASNAEPSENATPARFNSADSGYSVTDAPAIESTKTTDLATDLGCVSGSRLEVHRVLALRMVSLGWVGTVGLGHSRGCPREVVAVHCRIVIEQNLRFSRRRRSRCQRMSGSPAHWRPNSVHLTQPLLYHSSERHSRALASVSASCPMHLCAVNACQIHRD